MEEIALQKRWQVFAILIYGYFVFVHFWMYIRILAEAFGLARVLLPVLASFFLCKNNKLIIKKQG